MSGTARPLMPPVSRRALRAYGHWAYQYRRTWRGTVVTSVVSPLLYLAGLGVGLGTLVDSAQQDGTSYVEFLAPGLLAATAMQVAAAEGTWPVMGAIKWVRTYHAMLATPLSVGDVFAGHLLWVATRVLASSAAFVLVMVGFGVAVSWTVVPALLAALLVGLAFAAPIMTVAAHAENDAAFSILFRLGIVPMFLFSGTFFPVDDLPGGLQVVAALTPLYHGVELCRSLTLGTVSVLPAAGHTAVLLAWATGGVLLGLRAFRDRLEG